MDCFRVAASEFSGNTYCEHLVLVDKRLMNFKDFGQFGKWLFFFSGLALMDNDTTERCFLP